MKNQECEVRCEFECWNCNKKLGNTEIIKYRERHFFFCKKCWETKQEQATERKYKTKEMWNNRNK